MSARRTWGGKNPLKPLAVESSNLPAEGNALKHLSVSSSSLPAEQVVPVADCWSFSDEQSPTDFSQQPTEEDDFEGISERENAKRNFIGYWQPCNHLALRSQHFVEVTWLARGYPHVDPS